jgi:transketolase
MIAQNNHAAEELARTIRIGSIVAIHHAGSGHPGGALSAADLMAWLWLKELKKDGGGSPHPFILSKGHSCPALYSAAAEAGLISRESLCSLRKLGSPLQGHPHVGLLQWVHTSTGSLGQGFSFAVGKALGLSMRNSPQRVYVMLGDGELQEGECWEAAMFAAHYRLSNLCAIVDYNKLQSDDYNAKIMALEPLAGKWEAFNWHVVEIDGHSFSAMEAAFEQARGHLDGPSVIIAHTHKGRGVSFMEDSPLWHGSVKLKPEETLRALQDLGVNAETGDAYLRGEYR